MDNLQKNTAQAIVNIFETGRLLGNYGSVTLIPGDSGHLTYGRSQTTLASGGLYLLVKDYCAAPGSQFAGDLRPYLGRLQALDLSLDNDQNLRSILARAGGDAVMASVQDSFFDRNYWNPATVAAQTALQGGALQLALSIATVYDSKVHGNFALIKNLTNAAFATPPTEQEWTSKYVDTRRTWLANNPNPKLHPCVYRMDELKDLIAQSKWALELPMTVRGIQITDQSFGPGAAPQPAAEAPPRASAQDPGEMVLSLQTPYQTGNSVEFLQHALVKATLLPAEAVDGVFGPLTAKLVEEFQKQKNLPADGIVGPATWSAIHDMMQQ
jgi:chitosanase